MKGDKNSASVTSKALMTADGCEAVLLEVVTLFDNSQKDSYNP